MAKPKSRLRRAALLLVGLLLLVAAVVVVNTLRFRQETVSVTPVTDIEVDAGAAAERLARAVRFETVSYQDHDRIDRGAFLALHAFLEEAYPRVHAALAKDVVGGLSLLYTWPGRDPGRKGVLLMGHQDVVPVISGTESDWTHPPFAGKIADGFVWGRGALDDKSSMMGSLEAVELLLAGGFGPERTVYLAFGHDEEIGGREGAAAIAARLESQGVGLAYVVDEGGFVTRGVVPGVRAPVALVGIAEKGYLTLELSAEGEGGHSSAPPRHTAAGRVARAVARLEANPFPARLDGAARAMFDHVGPAMPFGQRLVFANSWLFRPLLIRTLAAKPSTNAMVRTTTAATMLAGSEKENVLPIRASAIVNFRILPGDTYESVTARVVEIVDDPRVEMKQLANRNNPSAVADVGSPSYKLLTRTIREIRPEEDLIVAPYLLIAQTDSRHFIPLSEATYRFLGLKVDGDQLTGFHGTNERVAVEEYGRAVEIFYQLIRNTNEL